MLPIPAPEKKPDPEVEALKQQLASVKLMMLEREQKQEIQEKMQQMKSEAIQQAREQLEMERRAEEEKQKILDEARMQGEKAAREKFEAEMRAELERKQRQSTAKREAEAKVAAEAEEEMRRMQAESQKRRQEVEELKVRLALVQMGHGGNDTQHSYVEHTFGVTLTKGSNRGATASSPRASFRPKVHTADVRPPDR